MKKQLILIAMLLLCILPSQAEETLQAGIQKVWTVDDARREAFRNAKQWVDVSQYPAIDPDFIANKVKNGNINNSRLVTNFGSSGLYSVSYVCSNESIIYEANGRFVGVTYSSTPVYSRPECPQTFPAITYKHTAIQSNFIKAGQLLSVSINITPGESYVFDPDGSMNAHWVKQLCFNPDGSSCGTRRSFETR